MSLPTARALLSRTTRACATLGALAACAAEPPATGEPPTTTTTGSGAPTTAPDPDAGLALLPALAGLWSGPAHDTPLGDFPLMNVDFRAMDDGLLWGRVDLDPENALRFGFSVESRSPDQVVYRNGGYFLGMLRDDRATLVEHDPDAQVWRFCHAELGCDYADAMYDLDGDALLFDVHVRGEPHVSWQATRLEERALPEGFPSQVVAPDAPLPAMPEVQVTVDWADALTEPADVWIVLSTEACLPDCAPSRSSRVTAEVGATSATVVLPELHPGAYHVLAILDQGQDFAATLAPGPGDGLSLPTATVDVAATGVTTRSVSIVIGA